MMNNLKLSFSQINLYLKCPMAFYFRYVERIKIPPSSALTLGSSFHKAMQYGFEEKIEKKRYPKSSLIKEVFSDTFDKLKNETEWKKEEKPGKLKDEGIMTTGIYYNNNAKKMKPKVVETRFEVEAENKDEEMRYNIILIPDLITEDEMIVDFKSKRRSPGQKAGLDTYLQLLLYSLGYIKEYGKKPKLLRTDYIIFKKDPAIITYKKKPSNDDYNNLLNTIDNVAKAIENEIFYINPNCSFCSPDYCGYWKFCMKGKKI